MKRPLLLKLLLASSIVLLILAATMILAVWWALRDLYSAPTLTRVAQATMEVNRLFSSDSALLYEFAEERRTWIPLAQVPQGLSAAILAVEDRDFYSHSGLSLRGLARSIFINLKRGQFAQGGSTITQQIARHLFLSREKKLWRKILELEVSRRLERDLTKDEILEIYLNIIYLGQGSYGVEEAARTWFCKSARDLNLSESMLLAGMIGAPERFSPLKHPERARARWEHSRGRYQNRHPDIDVSGLRFPDINPCSRPAYGLAPHSVSRVRSWLIRTFGEEAVARGGLSGVLTLDSTTQAAMEQGVLDFLSSLQPDDGISPFFEIRDQRPATATNPTCRVIPGEMLWVKIDGELQDRDEYPVRLWDRSGVLPAAALDLPLPGWTSPSLSPGQWILATPAEELDMCSAWEGDPKIWVPVASPQLAAVLLDGATGQVVASFGGVGNRFHPFDRAFDSHRTIGSTIKPFIYMAAMEAWDWTPDTLLPGDLKTRFKNGTHGTWRITEPGGSRFDPGELGTITVRDAIVHSMNTPSVGVLSRLGLARFQAWFKNLGMTEPTAPDLTTALGNLPMSPLSLAMAYTVFSNGGKVMTPYLVERIQDRSGEVLFAQGPQQVGSLDNALVRNMADILRDVMLRGTGKQALPSRIRDENPEEWSFGGKTGTTSDARDCWFAGWIDEYVLVVWIGRDDNQPLEQASGPQTAARLWKNIMERVLR